MHYCSKQTICICLNTCLEGIFKYVLIDAVKSFNQDIIRL